MSHQNDITTLCLTQIALATPCVVHAIKDKFLRLKLLEMGCALGMQIEKIKTAVARGPVLIKIYPQGNMLVLRHEEAAMIWVQQG